MKSHWLNWTGKESLDQRFERVAGIGQPPTDWESGISGTLISLMVNLTPSAEQPGSDFKPTLKIGNEAAPPGTTHDINNLRRITAISVEQGGVRHDFPIRFEQPAGRNGWFGNDNPLSIVITGLEGNEQRFESALSGSKGDFHRHRLDSTRPIAQFLADELAKKFTLEQASANSSTSLNETDTEGQMRTHTLNWTGEEALNQRFERVAGIGRQRTDLERGISGTLTSLMVNLTPAAEHPDTDFNPRLKIGNDFVPPSAAHDVNSIQKITAISVEQGGISHDFPIRFEEPSGFAGLRALFNQDDKPLTVVVTGPGGNEQSFHTALSGSKGDFHRHRLESTAPIADFLADELARKYMVGQQRAAPKVSGHGL